MSEVQNKKTKETPEAKEVIPSYGINLGDLKRPTKPPEKDAYFVGLHPNFKWKGVIHIRGLTFEKIVKTKAEKINLPGVVSHESEKDKYETHQKYGLVIYRSKEWVEEIRNIILRTIVTIDEGRIRTKRLEKTILEEDPGLDLNRVRPLGEFVYLIPVADCPKDFREKAFNGWEPKCLINPLEPSLV